MLLFAKGGIIPPRIFEMQEVLVMVIDAFLQQKSEFPQKHWNCHDLTKAHGQ
jgi:hypothetical protein